MKRLAALGLLFIIGGIVCWFTMIRMPGVSFQGALPELTAAQRSLAEEVEFDVRYLAETIGTRCSLQPRELEQAAGFLEDAFTDAGLTPQRQCYDVNGTECCNIEAEITGVSMPEQIIVIGGHYDTAIYDINCPGANDNASGTAGTLALARRFVGSKPARTLRFVCFVNEEAPHFQRDTMGSRRYARRCRERGEQVVAMISLETIGYYRDEAGTQDYPAPLKYFYPDTGDFIAIVGNVASRDLVRDFVQRFRDIASFPSQGAALPGALPGVGWSDHWAFWKEGYPAIMLTDTALFRDPNYHERTDTPEKLDYTRIARVLDSTEAVVRQWANDQRVPGAGAVD